MTTVYLDNAAATPLRPCAREAIMSVWQQVQTAGLNPQSGHQAGRHAAFLLDDARSRIAASLGADAAEIIMVAGATEADVIAVRGASGVKAGQPIIHTGLDHPAIGETARSCGPTRVCRVLADGNIDLAHFAELIAEEQPALVATTWVASETGAILPIAQMVECVRNRWADSVPILVDATQAIGKIEVDFRSLDIDMLALSGHKFGGPTATGVLVARRNLALKPVLTGGGQERGLRAGTQDVAGAQGLAAALEAAVSDREELTRQHQQLRDLLVSQLPSGLTLATTTNTVAAITMLVAQNCSAEPLLVALDMAGICVSAGSACHTGVARPSPALLAQGLTDAEALGSLRVSFGWANTTADVEALIAALPGALAAARDFTCA